MGIFTKHLGRAALGFVSTVLFVGSATSVETSASVPALSGHWGRTNFNLEQLPSGPRFIANTLKKPDGTIDDDRARVGDFTNPILRPEAAAILRQHGEFSRAGNSIPDPHNQCWPEPPPFVLAIQVEVLLLQQRDKVTLIYVNGQVVRHVRLNVPHAPNVTASWQGDSVGHYEGDTLVIDTIALKPHKMSVLDNYGTPHTEKLHVVERYRVVNDEKGKGLEAKFRVEDPGTFTMPWSGMGIYRPSRDTEMFEVVCAENQREFTEASVENGIPEADTPPF